MQPIVKQSQRRITLLAIATILSVSIYLMVSRLEYGTGFPLDDAWIHQTYARNLIQLGGWEYIPGIPSAGSTSPLWTVLLSLSYLFTRQVPFGWTFFLGGISLFALGILSEKIIRDNIHEYQSKFPLVGLCIIFEWHLVWASVSGMETLLQAFVFLLVLYGSTKKNFSKFILGILIGLSVWIRPDGITLIGPALFVLWLTGKINHHEKLKNSAWIILGFGILFIPYLLQNYFLSGSLWPNTFYAKQTEYAIYQDQSIFLRFFTISSLPLIGVGSLLLPGFFNLLIIIVKKSNIYLLAAVLWLLGYMFIYALRLPVTYQHGRYIIPAMPVYFVLGLIGTILLIQKSLRGKDIFRAIRRVLGISIGVLLVCFWILGATAYAEDVTIIETEMVQTAKWIAANTPKESLLAVHDIGAIGYYSERNLIDLAGLVSPELIPFMRDEGKLQIYLSQSGANYLVTFPGWYPNLVKELPILYQSMSNISIRAGGENMTIYQWLP